MKGHFSAISAEWIKLKNASFVWVTFIAFAIAPIMGGVFVLIMQDPVALEKAGTIGDKAEMMGMSADWASLMHLLTQAIGVGGVLVFGFVASWIFGREYAESTAKDILALPTSRSQIIQAKFGLYLFWCIALAISNLFLGIIIGLLVPTEGDLVSALSNKIDTYFLTSLLTILLGTPLAFLANWSRGYLAPLGFLVVMLVFSQIIAATGYGTYFPWAVPGLFSGISEAYKSLLNMYSFGILLAVSLLGYFITIWHWQSTDHTD